MKSKNIENELCDFACPIVKGCPIYFCRANYDCRYLIEVHEFAEKRYCLKRIEELRKIRDDKKAIWLEGE